MNFMMYQHQKKSFRAGYIMPLTLVITSLSVILATYITHRTLVFNAFASLAIKREKAKELALAGVQIAISQLVAPEEKKEKKEGKQQKNDTAAPATPAANAPKSDPKDTFLLKTILPSLNRWQTFALTEENDDIDATIRIAITSEQGKIDLNHIYDFEKKKFIGEGQPDKDYKKVIALIFSRIATVMKTKDLTEDFINFLSTRTEKFHDVTELLQAKNFNLFKDALFYHPTNKQQKTKNEQVYLADIFTTWSFKDTIEPWLFSDSWLAILNLPRATPTDIDKRRESVREWLKEFKEKSEWSTDWKKILEPVYTKDFNSLAKSIHFMLSKNFEATFFSIVSSAEIDDVQQQVVVIIERIKLPQKEKQKNQFEVRIRKLYWI